MTRMSEIHATFKSAIESRDSFDADHSYVQVMDITRDYFAASMHMIHAFAIVREQKEENDPADRAAAVEMLELIMRDDEVVSVERISLHHL